MPSHVSGRDVEGLFLRDGLISFFTLLIVFGAFDDITTDNSTNFTPEYTVLVACALWFGFVAVRLIREGYRTVGMVSLAALLGALWAQRGIGPGNAPVLWSEAVVIIGAFLWFLALASMLLVLGRRGMKRAATSRQ